MARRGRSWREGFEKLADEGTCRACPAPAADPAHVIPRSQGGDDDPLATVPLCRSCHDRYDGKVADNPLDLLPFLTLPEQAHAVELVGIYTAYLIICGNRPA